MPEASSLYDGIRAPFGEYGGSLAGVRPDDLATPIVTEPLKRNPAVDQERIDEVIFGDAKQAGRPDRRRHARGGRRRGVEHAARAADRH